MLTNFPYRTLLVEESKPKYARIWKSEPPESRVESREAGLGKDGILRADDY
jgi:hypothetical protein